jgi:hypothetical protein
MTKMKELVMNLARYIHDVVIVIGKLFIYSMKIQYSIWKSWNQYPCTCT